MTESPPVDLTVIMFAYNEEENVEPVMREALDFLRAHTRNYEMVLVDDGSVDGTREAALRVAAEDPKVRVVSHQSNRGIGGALHTGFAAANRDWVTILPADGQIDPLELKKFFAPMAEADIVICHYPNRFRTADNGARRILSRSLRALTFLATGVRHRIDGAYMIRRTALMRLPLKSETFFLNLELPIRAIRLGMRVAETTLEVRPRRAGESKVLNSRKIRLVAGEMISLGLEIRRNDLRRLFRADS